MRNHLVSGLIGALLVVSPFACASRPKSTRQAPEVTLLQTAPVPDIRVEDMPKDQRLGTTGVTGQSHMHRLPMNFQLQIINPFEYPVKLVSVEIESVGESGAYAMNRVRHAFERTIAPKSMETIDVRAWIRPLQRDMSGQTDSTVMLRGSARFETSVGVMRRNFVARGQ